MCAADNFACDFDGRSKLLPLPTVFEGVPVDVEKLAAGFGVPQYSPSFCVCRGHTELVKIKFITTTSQFQKNGK